MSLHQFDLSLAVFGESGRDSVVGLGSPYFQVHCHQGCSDGGCGMMIIFHMMYCTYDNHDDTVPCDDRFNCPKFRFMMIIFQMHYISI